MHRKPITVGIVLALVTSLCTSCPPPGGPSYDVTLRPIEAGAGTPLDAADVKVELFRQAEPIGVYDFDGVAYPIGGDEMLADVTVDVVDPACFFLAFCLPESPPEFGDPPDEARITVHDGDRTGFATVPIAPEDVVIEDEYYGRINLGTVEVTFEAQP